MADNRMTPALRSTLLAWVVLLLTVGARATGPADADPHRPTCTSAHCQRIRSFVRAHYCGGSPFGNGPDDSCDIKEPGPDRSRIDVIAHFRCERSGTDGKNVCQQYGQPPSDVRATLVRKLRQLGLPAAEDSRTYFTVWKSKSSEWSLAEGYYERLVGSCVALCQAIVVVNGNSQALVLREVPFQKTNAEVAPATTWSILDLTDVDSDGGRDVVLRGDAYEDHWIEVHSVQDGSHRMIFSGLGYYL